MSDYPPPGAGPFRAVSGRFFEGRRQPDGGRHPLFLAPCPNAGFLGGLQSPHVTHVLSLQSPEGADFRRNRHPPPLRGATARAAGPSPCAAGTAAADSFERRE